VGLCIAERSLQYSVRGAHERRPLAIRVFQPFLVQPGTVDFPADDQVYGCRWVMDGLPDQVGDIAYGADSLQALQFAVDVESVLRSLRSKYVLYFPGGEIYFPDEPSDD